MLTSPPGILKATLGAQSPPGTPKAQRTQNAVVNLVLLAQPSFSLAPVPERLFGNFEYLVGEWGSCVQTRFHVKACEGKSRPQAGPQTEEPPGPPGHPWDLGGSAVGFGGAASLGPRAVSHSS